MRNIVFFLVYLFLNLTSGFSQEKAGPVLSGSAKPNHSDPLIQKELLPPDGEIKIVNPKRRTSNRVVPGKGYPKIQDQALQKKFGKIPSKAPIISFDAAISGSTPTDPTGAVGPDHYVNAWNSAFAIYDKRGNLLLPPTSLSSLGGEFVGEDLGDPIVQYDAFADRFLIMQFAGCPECSDPEDETNALLVAISQGPDPVNDGWFTYRFRTGTFPDYPKLFIWSDGYYVTTNQDPTDPNYKEVVYVLERDAMLAGAEAQLIGLPLPGADNNGFYSPAAFNAVGDRLPPKGDAPILFFQDDAWLGVNRDHLKIWLVNVNWRQPEESSIVESQELEGKDGITPFHSTFDGGSFRNLSQPESAPDVDALQGAVMYPTSYRRFEDHNSVVFNFVVDVDPGPVEHAGIRWYELRQSSAGGPWKVYQEGTYAPDNSDRWCGSIMIDGSGNIGLGFTIVNDNPEFPIFPSLRYTGRYAGDPLGIMTLEEEVVAESLFPDPSHRYGDYAHLSIDPVDEETFWFISEYFGEDLRLNKVAVFSIAPKFFTDLGVVDIVEPTSSTLDASETISLLLRNFGKEAQSEFQVWYSIDGGPKVFKTFPGTLESTEQMEFSFTTTADLSGLGEEYEISAGIVLPGDQDASNDVYTEVIENLLPKDIGVTVINAPDSGTELGSESVIVTIENFGGEPQSNFPVGYSIDGEEIVTEIFSGTLGVREEAAFSFNQQYDFSIPKVYEIQAATFLEGDSEPENDGADRVIAKMDCIPRGSSCAFGDGISDFYLGDIVNENIYCTDGYYNFIGMSTVLDRTAGDYSVGVSSHSENHFSLWIDFNDNAVFEAEELLIDSELVRATGVVQEFELNIPDDAALGQHLMRVRAGDTRYGGVLNNPCSVMDYGMTQDYSVFIVDQIELSEIYEGDLVVAELENDVFEISFETLYQQPLWLTVHDMRGQLLVENLIEKNRGLYSYLLDMSYAATGVYLVRIGTREEGRVQRILVD